MLDVIVAGCGFCGSIIGRKLAEAGCRVEIFEKRNHIAGNMYDELDEHGILIQKYGPHAIHTNSEDVNKFFQTYSAFTPYQLKCGVLIKDKILPSPFNYETVDFLFDRAKAEELKRRLETEFKGQDKASILELLDSKDPLIKEYAEILYKEDYEPYTAKQWGIPPSEIDKSVLRRVPVLFSYKDGYFDDPYQYLPENGYTDFFGKLITHPNIKLYLSTDVKSRISFDFKKKLIIKDNKVFDGLVVFTGALDELLDYEFGVLPYRSLTFEYRTYDKDSFQEAAVTAYPKAAGYTRITEYKKLPFQNIPGKTTVAYEYPLQYDGREKQEPYYPIPNDINIATHRKYLTKLEGIKNLYTCGRLADYKYYNMDNAVERALSVSETILKEIKL
jgi:UDP-galactopyranose mutase